MTFNWSKSPIALGWSVTCNTNVPVISSGALSPSLGVVMAIAGVGVGVDVGFSVNVVVGVTVGSGVGV